MAMIYCHSLVIAVTKHFETLTLPTFHQSSVIIYHTHLSQAMITNEMVLGFVCSNLAKDRFCLTDI